MFFETLSPDSSRNSSKCIPTFRRRCLEEQLASLSQPSSSLWPSLTLSLPPSVQLIPPRRLCVGHAMTNWAGRTTPLKTLSEADHYLRPDGPPLTLLLVGATQHAACASGVGEGGNLAVAHVACSGEVLVATRRAVTCSRAGGGAVRRH